MSTLSVFAAGWMLRSALDDRIAVWTRCVYALIAAVLLLGLGR
jgi:hypothetical protein